MVFPPPPTTGQDTWLYAIDLLYYIRRYITKTVRVDMDMDIPKLGNFMSGILLFLLISNGKQPQKEKKSRIGDRFK